MDRPDFEGALKEIVTMIDTAISDKRIRRISIEQIQIIAVSYRVNPYTEFSETLAEFYRDYLKQCLEDKVITEAEAEDLAHLKLVLGLNDLMVEQIHEEVVQSVYKAGVAEVLEDGRVDEDEREFLSRLQRDLRLSDEIAETIYQIEAKEYLQRFFSYIVADERLSPEEESELNAITRSLGVDIEIDGQTQSVLNKYRLYWVIENGRLPQLDVDIVLRPDEHCYFQVDVRWFERNRDNLSERVGHIRFFKPDYQPLTDLDAQPQMQDWQYVDEGNAFVTNQRIILEGKKLSASIDLKKIWDVRAYRDGVELMTSSGPSPFIQFRHGIDIFIVLLGRALYDLN